MARAPARAGRRPVHGRLRSARRTCASRHRRTRHRWRDEAAGPGIRASGHQRQGPGFRRRSLPHHLPRLLDLGIDITRQPIPVVPAAHYTCGGVVTDLCGRADLPNLYAVGEVAHTGLHGANRMASNSLLECLVFGADVARDINRQFDQWSPHAPAPDWDESRVTDSDEEVVVTHNWAELRQFMWDYVGIVRTTKRLERAQHRVKLLHDEIHDYYGNFRVHRDLLELRNLVQVADLIVRSALSRRKAAACTTIGIFRTCSRWRGRRCWSPGD
ncbi:FAD-binding protein [Hankyongella ginsenosidimutans]|uniref:FAD-binding protein n=1 Tax=Hankyongella ginsenosidimutans TaxID=1763828 RepID=UPI0024827539|nr:FAD-binding protein [Hankyongella ginsenosidimutans]